MSKGNTTMYIGLDVSDEKITTFIIKGQNSNGILATIDNSPDALLKFVAPLRNAFNLKVAMETGTDSPWMSKFLESEGCDVVVGHARKIKAIWGDTNKCDERDAETLCRMLRADSKMLHPVKHCSEENRADLAIIKARDVLVRTRTSLINHIRGTLKSFGIRPKGLRSETFGKRIREFIPKDLITAFLDIVKQINSLDQSIKSYDKRLQKLCKKHEATQILQQIKGVGPVTALCFALIIEDPSRFKNGRRVGAFVGLTPRRDQSGNSDKQLGITKSGNGLLRRSLIQAANYIMGPFGEDSDLRRFGLKLAERRGGKAGRGKAKTAVARKLCCLLRTLWLDSKEYVPLYLEHKQSIKAQNAA